MIEVKISVERAFGFFKASFVLLCKGDANKQYSFALQMKDVFERAINESRTGDKIISSPKRIYKFLKDRGLPVKKVSVGQVRSMTFTYSE